MRTVLILGAGVGGPTLAYWLARRGLQPTVVERAQSLRSSGNPVDVRGPAVPVADAMGLLPRLREVATRVTAMTLVDDAGRRVARLPMPATRRDEVEVPRGDLAAVLAEAARDHAEFVFDDTITELRQDADGVDVTFDRAAPRHFDLVVGADGLHSTVRRLAFGPEQAYVRPLGLYVATLPLGKPADDPAEVLLYNRPGQLASVHPARGQALAAFIFRHPIAADLDYRDTARQRTIVTSAYADAGWRVPELLDRVRDTDDLYFDAVSTVDLPSWSRGRVTLLGDAASCVSLLGDGSSLAMAGAHTLARSLAEEPDHAVALRRYETEHRRLVAPKQRNVGRGAAMLVPRTRAGLAVRNLAMRIVGRRR
jgi:2-polyprenyl-6-methoxyphenol hydroxylase-like FAD-dependent oxidoreductase